MEARAIAQLLSLNDAKRKMYAIAEHYDQLAEQAERKSKEAADKN